GPAPSGSWSGRMGPKRAVARPEMRTPGGLSSWSSFKSRLTAIRPGPTVKPSDQAALAATSCGADHRTVVEDRGARGRGGCTAVVAPHPANANATEATSMGRTSAEASARGEIDVRDQFPNVPDVEQHGGPVAAEADVAWLDMLVRRRIGDPGRGPEA